MAAGAPLSTMNLSAKTAARDFYQELGIRPIINAAGSYTMFTGSLMRPEVIEAIAAMSKKFVRFGDVQDAVGKRIAAMAGAKAACVTSGAAGALLIGTAGVLTGKDPEKIIRIPDLTGMKSEVIIQKSHRFPYDHLVRNCGIKMIEVETRAELERAIGDKTAMLLFLNKADHLGAVKMKEFVEIGRKHGVPTMNDAAADVPPVENLLNPIKLGFDLVAISGGKGIRGPQSAGILFGREDLIEAARLNTLPHSDSIGRGCKVNKEEVVGMMVAFELFMKEDHAALYKDWDKKIAVIEKAIATVKGVRLTKYTPKIANQVPHLRVEWDAAASKVTPAGLMQKLREGEPSIELVPGPEAGGVDICSWTLGTGEAEIVGRRVKEILLNG